MKRPAMHGFLYLFEILDRDEGRMLQLELSRLHTIAVEKIRTADFAVFIKLARALPPVSGP